jgi:threonylcarbamoyladenosine tRNA methylthiotransferase MtaB
MKRIALHTLGCKLNYAETAAIGKQCTAHGYTIVGIDDPADVVVINSCSVTLHADRECRQVVRRALRHSPAAFIVVVGCYAQLQAKQIAEIKGVDLILGTQEKYSLFDYIGEGRKNDEPSIAVSCIDNNALRMASSAGFEDRTRVFLKVQDGCDYSCTYCTIPLARGKSRSILSIDIVRQAREAVELGYQEIVLTGVNVGEYGIKDGTNLLALLKQLVVIDGLKRLRISSIEPNLLTDELLDFWFMNNVLCNHWHIPLQSGSDSILHSMKRRYRTRTYAQRLQRIKSTIPTAGIGADVIVGFPGETDELFRETLSFLNDLPISYLHIFSYSERPNTPAAEFIHKIEPRSITERSKKLHSLGIQKRRSFYEMFIGKTVHVLFESEHPSGRISGLTEEYVRVEVESMSHLTNTIAAVMVQEVFSEKCTGIIAGPASSPIIRLAI